MLKDLNNGTIDGILLDAITSNSLNDTTMPPSSFHIAKTFDLEVNYGIGLSRDAVSLEQLFKEYINEHPEQLDVNEKYQRKGNTSKIIVSEKYTFTDIEHIHLQQTEKKKPWI